MCDKCLALVNCSQAVISFKLWIHRIKIKFLEVLEIFNNYSIKYSIKYLLCLK